MSEDTFSEQKQIEEAFNNIIILRDDISLKIMEEICQEKNIPFIEFSNLVIWAYLNQKNNMQGVKKVVDDLLNKME